MATDVIAPGADDGGSRPPERRAADDKGGFFHVYKSGQGYWTRLGTAAALSLIVIALCHFIWTQAPAYAPKLQQHRNVLIGVLAGFGALCALIIWIVMNRPTTVDFLIGTDGEMKKVNWTSRKELIGSTKVVILFMFLIAALLFFIDVVFGYLFYFARVLKHSPLF